MTEELKIRKLKSGILHSTSRITYVYFTGSNLSYVFLKTVLLIKVMMKQDSAKFIPANGK